MKRGGKKTKDRKKIIILVAIILLIIVFFFIAIRLTGKVVGQVTGLATSVALYNCTDSDNGINYFEKGFCEDGKQEYEDACYSPKGLWEYYCGNDRYACIRQETACPYGCSNGVCEARFCVDSDNGKNYEVKGTATLDNKEHVDYCLDDNKSLMEYYCYGNSTYGSLKFECDNGCLDGACVGNSAPVNESSEVVPEEVPPIEEIKTETKTNIYSNYWIFALVIILIIVLAFFFFKRYNRK